ILVAGGRIVADGPAHEIRAMAAAKTVSATLPLFDMATDTETPAEAAPGVAGIVDLLGGLAGVDSVQVHGQRLPSRTAASAPAAQPLFDNACTDLEISSHSLEDACISLTSQA